MSAIKVKTQTRFMVLFTSWSLLTGGTSRHLTWHLPQVFACYLPLMNYIPLSFTDITLWQNMPFLCRKQTGGGKIWLSYGGPQYLPSAALVPTPLPPSGKIVLPEWP